jgi:Fe-S-cluster containining protein
MLEFFLPLSLIGSGTKEAQDSIKKKPDFSQWNPENPCYGCGACCSNVRLELSLLSSGDEQFGNLLPYVKNPNEPIELKDVPKETGVYYAIGRRGHHFLVVIGDCPELNSDGSCNIHDQPRPKGCVSSGLDSPKCITSQKNQ